MSHSARRRFSHPDRALTILVATAVVTAVVIGFAGPASASGPGLNPPAWTGHYHRLVYPGVVADTSVPIRMSDGTVLRADVYRPADAANRAIAKKTPVIVNMTPYNKLLSMLATVGTNIPYLSDPILDFFSRINLSGTPISGMEQLLRVAKGGLVSSFSVDPNLVRAGYTQVVVDVRGTGTSEGKWDVFGPREQQDTLEVLNWARKRRYSNGDLGMSGYSYSAVNQLQAAAKHPLGLKAIFPAAPMTDILNDVVAPGSGFGAGFLALWLIGVNTTKFVPDLPSLLRGQFDPKWLADRIANPATFVPEYLQGLTAPNTESLTSRAKELVQQGSAYRKALTTDASQVRVPTFVIGGWQDLFTNMEWRALNQLSSLPPTQKKLLMSTGAHVTNGWDTLGRPGQPPSWNVLQRAWFDKWIKGVDNKIDQYAPATSHLQGAGWVQSGKFPRGGQQRQRLYLTARHSRTSPTSVADGSLATAAPTQAATWTVAPGITTLCSGDTNRDQVGLLAWLDPCAADNRIAERGALTFTSPPVRQNTTINGPLNVHLRTKVDAKDGFYAAVVSDVAPDGSSKELTTGSMTVSLRNQLERDESGFAPNGDVIDPHYALDAFHRDTVTPGSSQYVDVGALGTDALLKPGHRLRVSVYAFNAPRAVSFGPISHDSGLKPEHVVIDPRYPSWLQLPTSTPIG